MRKVLVLVLLLTCADYQSQVLAQGNEQKAINGTSSSKTEARGSESSPIVIKILPSPKNDAEAKKEEEERNKRDASELLKQKTDTSLVNFTGQLANYTWLLVVVGGVQVCILIAQIVYIHRQEKSTKTIERAYVKMSHTYPGLTLENNETTEWYKIKVKIENCGKTPALVTGVRLCFKVLDWDEAPPHIVDYRNVHEEHRIVSAFLVPTDTFYLERTSPGDKRGVIRSDSKRLIVFGYIDYTDAFGQEHRAGYAREYKTVTGKNLFFFEAKGYNYDRPRKKSDRQDQDTIEA